MTQSFVECLAGLLQELTHTDIIDTKTQGKSIDKHTHRICNLQVRASTADGTEIDLTIVGIPRYHVGRCSKEQMGGCHLMLTTEGCSLVVVRLTDCLADEALLPCFWQISRNLTGTLTGRQLLSKELL